MKKKDADIIKGCQLKDPVYERLLVEKYAAVLLTVSRRYARSKMEAEDVLQDAFIKIFENMNKYKIGRGSLEGWMRTIVIRTALRDYRDKYPMTKNIEFISHEQQMIGADIIEKLNEEDLLKIIGELPEGYRQIFNLYVIDGYSHKEIGNMLNITESTSRSQLTRAKGILKKKLTNHQINSICTTTVWTMALGLN